mmetsp:Transcript_26721/g.83087  ORF Transcript_26721/g.83087 Transcript_26721/m.83087 type:complete len:256 (+) Transcript_26721:479-1246(+)
MNQSCCHCEKVLGGRPASRRAAQSATASPGSSRPAVATCAVQRCSPQTAVWPTSEAQAAWKKRQAWERSPPHSAARCANTAGAPPAASRSSSAVKRGSSGARSSRLQPAPRPSGPDGSRARPGRARVRARSSPKRSAGGRRKATRVCGAAPRSRRLSSSACWPRPTWQSVSSPGTVRLPESKSPRSSSMPGCEADAAAGRSRHATPATRPRPRPSRIAPGQAHGACERHATVSPATQGNCTQPSGAAESPEPSCT